MLALMSKKQFQLSLKYYRCASTLNNLKNVCNTKIASYKRVGILKTDNLVVIGVNGATLRVKNSDKVILNFGSSDCYGLSVSMHLPGNTNKIVV